MENAFRPARGGLGPLFRAALTAAGLALPVLAPAQPALLTVGQGWAWAREFFPPSGERDIDHLVWTRPPRDVDLDTLQVWGVRRPWPVREWRWTGPGGASAPETPPEAPVVWRPEGIDRPRHPAHDRLDIRLEAPLSHRMGHSLTYRLPGFDWEANYHITVRGIGPKSIQSVQMDLAAYVRIENGTDASYPDARLSLVGRDGSQRPPPRPFGRLDLNPDTPLSDLWLNLRDPIPLLPQHYALQAPASIPARGEAEIRFAAVGRRPAAIVHVCDSDAVPAPTQSGGLPLRRLLEIANTAANGLGFPLPPGDAHLRIGAGSRGELLTGRVLHTPFPGRLRIDMGETDSVRATRQAGEEVPLPEGVWQSDHTITLVNRLDSPVQIQIIEKPATPKKWNLVRSSVPAVETPGALRFDLTLPAQSTRTVDYRLRLVARTL
ncbi:MAG: hypothetical protein GX548_06650 [Lentisphaerae bacterium]|nr:hypothetical protein [Lentisphaerota bacterium]